MEISEKNKNQLLELSNGNKFIGEFPVLNNSKILFNGQNNILFCDKNTLLNNSQISFNANNSLIYLNEGKYYLEISLCSNSTVYVGKKNYFNPAGNKISIYGSEEKNIFIGNGNLFSHGCYIRTADPHLIYDIKSRKRINLSKSVYIGDHVWLGQNCAILKGTKIQSNSIIGAQSVCAGKTVYSNTICAGNPIKTIKKDVFWVNDCVHNWTNEETEKKMTNFDDDNIYEHKENEYISFDKIESTLKTKKTAQERYLFLKDLSNNKNRFTL